MIRLLTILATTIAAALAVAGPAAAVTMTEFPIEPGAPAGSHTPSYLKPGPDGGLWFVDEAARSIGRMTLQGQRVAPIPTVAAMIPHDLAVGADGTTFWTQDDYGLVTRAASGQVFNARANGELPAAVTVDATGRVWWGTQDTMSPGNPVFLCKSGEDGNCYRPAVINNARFTGVAIAADGGVWVVGNEQNAVWRFAPATSTFPLRVDLPVGSAPNRIALGPDGNMWVTETAGGSVDRITPAGVLTRFPVGAGKAPNDITRGPDGALWFTETDGNAIGRITTAGQVTEFPAPTPASKPTGITTGPDGALWFTTNAAGTLVRLKLDPPAGGTPGTGGVVRDTRAPRFDRPLKVASSRFRASKGTVFSFSLSEPAKVALVIERSKPGRRVKRTCRTRTSENRRRPSCTLWKKVGTLSKNALQGANRVTFSGRLNGSRLAAGSYRARATAKDAAGNTSAASTVRFTITR